MVIPQPITSSCRAAIATTAATERRLRKLSEKGIAVVCTRKTSDRVSKNSATDISKGGFFIHGEATLAAKFESFKSEVSCVETGTIGDVVLLKKKILTSQSNKKKGAAGKEVIVPDISPSIYMIIVPHIHNIEYF